MSDTEQPQQIEPHQRRRIRQRGCRPTLTRNRTAAAEDDGVDLLMHLDPCSPSFYAAAAATAAYLVNGKGRWLTSCQCVLTAALMHHAMLAAREKRACSLSEVQSALAEASRRIRSRNHHRRDTSSFKLAGDAGSEG